MLQRFKTSRARIWLAIAAFALVPTVVGIHAAASAYQASSMLAGVASREASTRVALVIGNAAYPDANAPLVQSAAAAQALASSLRARGYDVDFEENLTKTGMDRAITAFADKVKPGVTALVSFGGFGIQVDRENYLIPIDAAIWKASDVAREGTNLNALLARLAGKGADVTIAILDASRRNPFERRFRSVSEGLAAVEAPRGALVLSSTTPNKTISEGDPRQTRAIDTLIAGMAKGESDVEVLFNRTRQEVSLASKEEQVPLVSSSLLSGASL